MDEILSDIRIIEKDLSLYEEKHFNDRQHAIDDIEFLVFDRLDLMMESTENDQLLSLKQYAEKVRSQLEEVNTNMFRRLRTRISQGEFRGKDFMTLIDEYFELQLDAFLQQDITGYNNLDIFLNGLLTDRQLPSETKEREPEMVWYQKTPARIILEIIIRAEFKPQDIFFDLGSGLGQVAILVNLITDVISKGVEFEPAFCSFAKACAADFNLSDVEFINMDARSVDYSLGTVFFMYTPFEGKILQDVLQKLNEEAKKRKIKIFTYGPCTREVAKQNWLIKRNVSYRPGELGEFVSV